MFVNEVIITNNASRIRPGLTVLSEQPQSCRQFRRNDLRPMSVNWTISLAGNLLDRRRQLTTPASPKSFESVCPASSTPSLTIATASPEDKCASCISPVPGREHPDRQARAVERFHGSVRPENDRSRMPGIHIAKDSCRAVVHRVEQRRVLLGGTRLPEYSIDGAVKSAGSAIKIAVASQRSLQMRHQKRSRPSPSLKCPPAQRQAIPDPASRKSK